MSKNSLFYIDKEGDSTKFQKASDQENESDHESTDSLKDSDLADGKRCITESSKLPWLSRAGYSLPNDSPSGNFKNSAQSFISQAESGGIPDVSEARNSDDSCGHLADYMDNILGKSSVIEGENSSVNGENSLNFLSEDVYRSFGLRDLDVTFDDFSPSEASEWDMTESESSENFLDKAFDAPDSEYEDDTHDLEKLGRYEEEDEVIFLSSIRQRHRKLLEDIPLEDGDAASAVHVGRTNRNKKRNDGISVQKSSSDSSKNLRPELYNFYRDLIKFSKDESNIYQIVSPQLPKRARGLANGLCYKHGMKVQTFGKGAHRYIHVTRTKKTRPINESDKLLSLFHRALMDFGVRKDKKIERQETENELKKIKKKLKKNRKYSKAGSAKLHEEARKILNSKKQKSKAGRGKFDRDIDADKGKHSSRVKHGEIVGGDADPIETSNRGHQMLLRMGWNPGSSLGSTTKDMAIKSPVEAVFKARKTGLGFD